MVDVTGEVINEVSKAGMTAIKAGVQLFSLLFGLIGFGCKKALEACRKNGVEIGNDVSMTLAGKDSIKRLFTSEEEVWDLGEYMNKEIGKKELKEIKNQFKKFGVHFSVEKIGEDPILDENGNQVFNEYGEPEFENKYRIHFAARNASAVKAAMKNFAESHEVDIDKFEEAVNMTDEQKKNDPDFQKTKSQVNENEEKREIENEQENVKNNKEQNSDFSSKYHTPHVDEYLDNWAKKFDEDLAKKKPGGDKATVDEFEKNIDEKNNKEDIIEESEKGENEQYIYFENGELLIREKNEIIDEKTNNKNTQKDFSEMLEKSGLEVETLVYENDNLETKPLAENLQAPKFENTKSSKAENKNFQEKTKNDLRQNPKNEKHQKPRKASKEKSEKRRTQEKRANPKPTSTLDGINKLGTHSSKQQSHDVQNRQKGVERSR